MFALEELSKWPASGKAQFALALPFETATWDWIECFGEDAAAEYWRTTYPYSVSDAARDLGRAIRTLVDHRRPFAALRLATVALHPSRGGEALTPELLLTVLRAATSAATGEIESAEPPPAGDNLGYEVGELLLAAERLSAADEAELARIEWVWLPVLENTQHGMRTLSRLLTRDAQFFAMAVGLMHGHRSASDGNAPPPPADEHAKERGIQAWRMLNEWKGVPGFGDSGLLDEQAFRVWIRDARETFRTAGHAKLGDRFIGEMLARIPDGSDGVWPHECLRRLLEELRSVAIENGLYLGIVNGRGSTCRSPDDGGEQELGLAEKYESWAHALGTTAPRAAGLLRRVRDNYRVDATWEDDRRDLNEFMH
jgi:hypothetical protein